MTPSVRQAHGLTTDRINDEFRRLIIAALMNNARQQGSKNRVLLDRACEKITQEECDGSKSRNKQD